MLIALRGTPSLKFITHLKDGHFVTGFRGWLFTRCWQMKPGSSYIRRGFEWKTKMLLIVRVEEICVSSRRTQLPHCIPGLPQCRPITANTQKSQENANTPRSSCLFVSAAAAQQARRSAQVWVQGCKPSVLQPRRLAEDEWGKGKAGCLGRSNGNAASSLCAAPSIFPRTWAMAPHLSSAAFSCILLL